MGVLHIFKSWESNVIGQKLFNYETDIKNKSNKNKKNVSKLNETILFPQIISDY